MSNGNSSEDDEQLARDMQLAMDLQAREEQKAECRRRKEEEKARRSHHSTLEDGFARDKLNADHMLFVKCCVDGGREVDLLVDTGASVSAISTDMVQKLSLTEKLNTTISGDAKGVGSSSIVGVVENVECRLGHVEFRLFFMVLEGLMPYCILGLDQMRRFKCQVDLDEDVLIFGGKDGVKVPFLSQSEAMMAAYKMIGNGESVAAATDSGQQSGVTGKLKSLFKKN